MTDIMMNSNADVDRAIIFAVQRHAGQTRKGTDIPYITHPMEVATLLTAMGADNNLVIAGLLHDVVEDSGVSLEEVKRMFGSDVAQLVAAHSEDKTKSWQERKQHTIDSLPRESRRSRMLTLADKTANIRSIYRDYMALGDELWQRFNAGKENISWYYSGIIDGLDGLQYDRATKDIYREISSLYKDVFVKFFLDTETDTMFQLAVHGEGYAMRMKTLVWVPFSGELPSTAFPLARHEAEGIINLWNATPSQNAGNTLLN